MKNVGDIQREANIVYISMIRLGLDQTAKVSKLPEDINYIQKFALTNLLQHGRRSGEERLLIKEIFRQQRSNENKDKRNKRDRIEKVKSNILGFLCYIKSHLNAISKSQSMDEPNKCLQHNPRISILQVNNPPL